MKLELNVPKGREFKFGHCARIYRFNEDGILQHKYSELSWQHSFININSINNCEITLLPWKPEEGEKYWYVECSRKLGYNYDTNKGLFDTRVMSRVTVYQTEEEVKAAVKDLGWTII